MILTDIAKLLRPLQQLALSASLFFGRRRLVGLAIDSFGGQGGGLRPRFWTVRLGKMGGGKAKIDEAADGFGAVWLVLLFVGPLVNVRSALPFEHKLRDLLNDVVPRGTRQASSSHAPR